MRLTLLLIAAVALLGFPATASAPGPSPKLEFWQASRVARSHAKLQHRPDFRVEHVRRIDRYKVEICWSEPGYLGALGGRDFGCDVVQLRGREFFLYDDSILGAGWVRWL